jgi:hypothetical protein
MPIPRALKEAFQELVPFLRITSADEFYRRGREYGLDYPRHAFREAWRILNEETGYRFAIANLDPDRRIPSAWMRPTVDPFLARNTYIMNVTIRHPVTGYEHIVRGFTTSARSLTIGEAEEEIIARVTDSPTWRGWEVVKTEWRHAYRKS